MSPGQPADPDTVSARASSSQRAPWFEVSCCPPNVARTFASLAALIATVDDEGLQLHQYAPATIRTTLGDGRELALDVATEYPREGSIRVRVDSDAGGAWTLTLRVPAWADGARVIVRPVDGEAEESDAAPGSVAVRREFRAGDVVELVLPIAPRFTAPDSRIDAVRGCLAVERGPEVFALESVDLVAAGAPDADVADYVLDRSVPAREEDGRVLVTLRPIAVADESWPYAETTDAVAGVAASVEVPLIPYHEWAERGPSTMRIWIPTS